MTEEKQSDIATAPRNGWAFTEAQRVIIAILLWLNILVLVLVALLLLGVVNP